MSPDEDNDQPNELGDRSCIARDIIDGLFRASKILASYLQRTDEEPHPRQHHRKNQTSEGA